MKIAYANISDKRVAARTGRNDWLWYSMQAIEDIEQASGRATRSKEDWSEMFIFDSSFGDLLKRYNKCFKQWFKARVKQCPP
jgi:Rad3-related DNA helicase